MNINPLELSALSGLAASAATATILSVGSWPAAIGTGTVSVITTATSYLGAVCVADCTSDIIEPFVSEDVDLGIFAVSALVSLVALNSLALSAVIWTGLPIATLSLTAKVTASVAAALPISLITIIGVYSSEGSVEEY